MDLLTQRRAMMAAGEYETVSYIQSTGEGEYINLPVNKVKSTRYLLDFQFISKTTNFTYLVGDMPSSIAYRVIFGIGSSTPRFYSQCGGGSGYKYIKSSDTERHIVDITNGDASGQTFVLDGTTYTSSYTLTPNSYDDPIPIFKSPGLQLKVYSLKIWTDGELVADLIPVRKRSNREVGLLNKIGNVFLGNVANVGEFIAG